MNVREERARRRRERVRGEVARRPAVPNALSSSSIAAKEGPWSDMFTIMALRHAGFLVLFAVSTLAQDHLPTVSTFSIVGFDAKTREWGVAVASRYFSVGSVVPWAEAGIGAVATQANVNVGYGPRALDLLKQGLTA